jgi:hypothetical protein
VKSIATIFLLCALTVGAQTKKPKAPAPVTIPPQAAPAKPAADIVMPKETVDSLKLQLALTKQKSIQTEAQALQQQAMQAIEPRMVPLRTEFQTQAAASKAEEEKVRHENGFGPDIQLDQNFASPNFGQWVRQKGPEKK